VFCSYFGFAKLFDVLPICYFKLSSFWIYSSLFAIAATMVENLIEYCVNMILVEKLQRDSSRTPQKDQQQTTAHCKKMENQIYIHPSTMTMCGLTFMRPALVDHQHVLIAVPDARLPITSVNVSEWTASNVLDKKAGQFVVVNDLNSADLAATEVFVRLA